MSKKDKEQVPKISEKTVQVKEQEIVTRASLKKEFPTMKRIIAVKKPFLNRNCLLCDFPFPKKVKLQKTKQGANKYTCKKCGLTHYNVMNFAEILLVSPQDEEKYSGLLTFQKQTLLYASDEELDNYNKDGEKFDYNEDEKIVKEGTTLIKTNKGTSPIYEGDIS